MRLGWVRLAKKKKPNYFLWVGLGWQKKKKKERKKEKKKKKGGLS